MCVSHDIVCKDKGLTSLFTKCCSQEILIYQLPFSVYYFNNFPMRKILSVVLDDKYLYYCSQKLPPAFVSKVIRKFPVIAVLITFP